MARPLEGSMMVSTHSSRPPRAASITDSAETAPDHCRGAAKRNRLADHLGRYTQDQTARKVSPTRVAGRGAKGCKRRVPGSADSDAHEDGRNAPARKGRG